MRGSMRCMLTPYILTGIGAAVWFYSRKASHEKWVLWKWTWSNSKRVHFWLLEFWGWSTELQGRYDWKFLNPSSRNQPYKPPLVPCKRKILWHLQVYWFISIKLWFLLDCMKSNIVGSLSCIQVIMSFFCFLFFGLAKDPRDPYD